MSTMPIQTKASGKVAILGAFIALSMLFGYVENMFPINIVGVPGIKLGFANVITMIVMYCYGFKESMLVSVLRIALLAFMFGNIFGALYGLIGSITSIVIMSVFIRLNRYTLIGISAVGGAAHNLGQLIFAGFVFEEPGLIFYLPFLLIFGTVAGSLMGFLSLLVMERIKGINVSV